MSTAVEPYQAGVFDLTHKLTVEKHGHTALITINHPPANTWDRESLIGLKQVIDHLNHDDDIYALVICGQGEKFFSAGRISNCLPTGIATGPAKWPGASARHSKRYATSAACRLPRSTVSPWVEAWNARWLATCGSPNSKRRWGFRKPRSDCCPSAGGTQALAWLVGEGWAKRMILCGERITADTALRIGLVEQVVEQGQSRGHALLLASRVARQSPVAVRAIKP